MEHILTWEMMREYEKHLRLAEKSSSTIQKYLHDIWRFYEHLPRGKVFTKERVIAYKESLAEQYAISTANAILVAIPIPGRPGIGIAALYHKVFYHSMK